MRKGLKLGSLIAMGLFLLSLLASPLLAASPAALENYEQAVEAVMTPDGEISTDDRALLERKKGELGLTDEEAADIEEQVREGIRRI
jgi:hypothetical protein